MRNPFQGRLAKTALAFGVATGMSLGGSCPALATAGTSDGDETELVITEEDATDKGDGAVASDGEGPSDEVSAIAAGEDSPDEIELMALPDAANEVVTEEDLVATPVEEPLSGTLGGGSEDPVTLTAKPTHNTTGYVIDEWDMPRTSSLHERGDGLLERVEYDGQDIVVETYDGESLTGQKVIHATPDTFVPAGHADGEDVLWGGSHFDGTYNWVVTGQANGGHDDSRVVLRVSRYDEDWGHPRHYDFNDPCEYLNKGGTVEPFLAGNCDIERLGSSLHVRTTHLMYSGHQATLHLVLDAEQMTLIEKLSDVSNLSQTKLGYESHMFATRLASLDGQMYSLNHGDGSPRSVNVKRLERAGSDEYRHVLHISGSSGFNRTDVTLGGFEASEARGTLLSTFATGHQDQFAYTSGSSARNVILSVLDENLGVVRAMSLTDFGADSTVGTGFPKLTKVDDDLFCVLWAEIAAGKGSYWNSHNQKGIVRYVFVDGFGNPVSSVGSLDGYLSDCEPVAHDGQIVWYHEGNNNEPVFQRIPATPTGVYADAVRHDLSGATISTTSATYTGEPVTPKVFVRYAGATLEEGVDYTLRYLNNTEIGTARIEVTGIGDYSGGRVLTFSVTKIPTDVTVKAEEMSLSCGKTARIVASGTGALSYSSYDKKVATVDADGVVTGVAGGTATISVSSKGDDTHAGGHKNVRVTVTKLPSSITARDASVTIGGKVSLGASGVGRLTYASLSPSVASVDATGTVTGRSTGTARIAITSAGDDTHDGTTTQVEVTVRKASSAISASDKSVLVGDKVRLGASGTGKLSYSSSNPSVATVNVAGVVTGVSAGTAYVTIKSSGNSKVSGTSRQVAITVSRRGNPTKVTVSEGTTTAKRCRKSAKRLSLIKLESKTGKASFKKVSGSKRLSVNKKNGKVTVKKGTKKGRYSMRVKVSLGATDACLGKDVTVRVTVTVS